MKHISVGFVIASFLFVSGSATAQVSVATTLTDGDVASECLKLETSLLRFGSRDANTNYEVTALQDFLISKEFLTGQTTGYFGRLTVNAVKAYQKSVGVSPTGNVGSLTRAVIFEDSCKGTSSAPDGTGGINIGTSVITPGATIDDNSGINDAGDVVVFGQTSGLSAIGIVIAGPSGDKVYASGPITVSNNQYKKVISKNDIVVNPGQYLVYVIDYYKNVKMASKYITIGSISSAKATIDENSGQSDAGVTIFGEARGVSVIGITIGGPSGDKEYGSGPITVSNNQYKKVIPKSDIAVNPGKYMVAVFDYYTNTKLATRYITIGTEATSFQASPSVEVVGTPSIALKYDSNNKESLLAGYAKVKITAGKETLILNITNGAPTNLIGFSSENGNRVGAITRVYGSDEKGNNGNSYIATLRPGESEIYSAEISASAKHLLQGVYMVKVDSVYGQSGQLVLDGSTYKGETTSKRILVIGETSPNITGVSIRPTGEVTIKGTRFHPTSNIVAISGTSKTLPSTNNQTNIVFKASDFNLAVGQYFVTVESASEGKGNTFVFSVDEGTITTSVLSAKLTASPTTVDYLGGYDYFTLSSTGAVSCKLHYKEAPNAAWSVGQGIPSPNYTWKPYRGYTKTTSYYATCADATGKTVESNTITVTVLPKSTTQAACTIADIYAVQVPGYTYNDLYMKIMAPPSTVTTSTLYGITGAESWDNLTFTEYKSGDGYKILKATQTLNSTGAAYVISKKSSIQLKAGGAVICPMPAVPSPEGMGLLEGIPSQVFTTANTVTTALANGITTFASRALGASSASAMECTTLERNIHRGDESTTTTKLQQFLISKGFLSEKATGFFGDLTIEAVKAYQRSLGLKESGMVYDLTREAIMKETCQ